MCFHKNSAEGATTMAMSEERKDADGSFYNKIGFYAVENGETTELVKGTDYKESGNGNYTFLKEFTHVYGKITNSRVDNVRSNNAVYRCKGNDYRYHER